LLVILRRSIVRSSLLRLTIRRKSRAIADPSDGNRMCRHSGTQHNISQPN
jgi:hypothetical protein